MDTTTIKNVNPAAPDWAADEPYLAHSSFRRYMAQPMPRANKRRRNYSKYEACVVLFNEWDGLRDLDADLYAGKFNWLVDDVRAAAAEFVADGVFDLVPPTVGGN